MSAIARKREAREAQERLVNATTGLILHAARTKGLYVRRSNTGAKVDRLTRHVAPIDEALGRKR